MNVSGAWAIDLGTNNERKVFAIKNVESSKFAKITCSSGIKVKDNEHLRENSSGIDELSASKGNLIKQNKCHLVDKHEVNLTVQPNRGRLKVSKLNKITSMVKAKGSPAKKSQAGVGLYLCTRGKPSPRQKKSKS